MVSSLPLRPAVETDAFSGTCGVEMGIGTPPLMVPRRMLGLLEGLRRMVAVWGPIGSGSISRLTVDAGLLL